MATSAVVRVGALWSAAVASLAAQDFHRFLSGSLLPELQADVRAVAAGDLDGDGDRDLVFGCYGAVGVGERNYWLRNDGTGLFSVTGPGWVALAPSLTRAVALADFDGDGDLDAFFGNQRFDRLCRNDGTGHLSLAIGDLPEVDRETNDLAVGDIDGDGDLDVVAAGNGFNVLYRNGGSGVFSDDTNGSLPMVWRDCSGGELADFDGDGDLDLLLAGGPAELLWNDGLGHFTPAASTLPTGLAVSVGDVDGDGDRDFVLSGVNPSWFGVDFARLYRNDGSGTFTWSTFAIPAAGPVRGGDLVDVDADGDLDLVSNVGLLHNDGTGTFTWVAAEPRQSGLFADLDGDGDPDQVVGTRAFRNHGGTFSTGVGDLDPALGAVHELVDFDRDGDLDAVLVGSSSLRVVANDGRGRFGTVLVQRPINAWSIDSIGAADWTGDGWPDLLDVAGNTVLVNQAGAGLTSVPLPVSWVSGFVTADFDHDGDLDLVVSASNGVVVLRNVGGGAFTATAGLPPALFAAPGDLADFDADGNVDLLLVGGAQPPALWRGNGSGGFVAWAGSLPAGLSDVQAGLARDLDGDGAVDLALGHGVAVASGPRMSLLANDGAGHFAVVATPSLPVNQVSALAAADVDEDGDPDLVLSANLYTETSRLWRNDGAFVFVDVTAPGVPWRGLPAPTGSLALFGDVDGDGDVDVAATSPSGTVLLRNLRRQTWTWPDPVIGANWRIDVHARPLAGALVGVVVGTVPLTPGLTTPFGVLGIDPLSAQVFGPFAVAAGDSAAGTTLAIPPIPALQGAPLLAQGFTFTGGGLRLANATQSAMQ